MKSDMPARMPMLKIFTPKLFYSSLVVLIVVFLVVFYASLPPRDFPERKIVSIKSGQYLSQVAETLENENVIRSQLLFKAFVFLLSGHRQARATDYLFDKPETALRVAYRIIKGDQNLPKKKVTIREGMTVANIGLAIKKAVPDFDLPTFLVLAKPYEGYLFPDTYFFYENIHPEDVVDQLKSTFNQKIKTQLLAIQASGKSLEDVITMASIVEKEATKMEDRKIIAGILWKRIEIGMPLQVDPPFYYTLGKDSASLTRADLSSDSAYNTYTHKGLPPTPISNPGLSAIEATVNPTKTKYLFYLSDKKGTMHYAVDHDGHVENKAKYLR
jgi:UPF0755 protein